MTIKTLLPERSGAKSKAYYCVPSTSSGNKDIFLQSQFEIVGALVLLAGTAILFLAALAAAGFFGSTSGGLEKKRSVATTSEFQSPLTGLPINAAIADRRALAVMIDNHLDSRPPSGLEAADLIWEVPVEGGITRFLAVFQSQDAERIGPVRSARVYFIDWVRELDAVFAHVGGHHEALRRLRAEDRDIADADAFRAGGTFWRAASRDAPHSTYTTTERLRALIESRGWIPLEADRPPSMVSSGWSNHKAVVAVPSAGRPLTGWSASSTIPAWRFGEASGEPVETVSIGWGSPLFSVRYTYDSKSHVWSRELAGAPHRLSDGSELTTTNIAVMFVKVLGRPEPGTGTLTIETMGEGEALVFSGGKLTQGVWKKPTPAARTKFYKENGEEVVFRPGATWIEVVPSTLREGVTWE